MQRKAPKVGDIVRVPVEANAAGIVERCEGIHLYVRLFGAPSSVLALAHSLRQRGLSYVRRDSVEVISRANPR
tara:strand:+ start:611 stop:829 length:219 start_codon:yes stop_codon:yes gene_type:complete